MEKFLISLKRDFISNAVSEKPKKAEIVVILGCLGTHADVFWNEVQKLKDGTKTSIVTFYRPWDGNGSVAFRPKDHSIEDVLKAWCGDPPATIKYI